MPGGLDRAKNRSEGLDTFVSLHRKQGREHISSTLTVEPCPIQIDYVWLPLGHRA